MKRLMCITEMVLFVLFMGCSRTDPVEEISMESSGVEVRDQETWLEPSDWPGWRGPNNDGTARDQAIVTQWDDASNIVWQADVPGRGHSSPVVVGEQVFLTSAHEDRQQQLVLAYDRVSGEPRWSRTCSWTKLASPPLRSIIRVTASGGRCSTGRDRTAAAIDRC